MASRSVSRERYSFANLTEPLELPDLIAVQRESFEWFLNEGLAETFRDISPIKDFSEALQLELEFDPDDEDLRPPPKFSVDECKEKDMTYSAPIFVRARFMNRNTGEIKEQTVFMGDFPMMTEKGTFIINGTERVVVSQLVRSPGVIFEPGERFRLRNLSKHQLVKGTIHPYRGEWLEFDVEQKPGKDVTAGTRVARKRRMGIFTLLRALGYDEEHAPGFIERFVGHFDFLEASGRRSATWRPPRTRRSSRSTSAPAPASRPRSSRPRPTSAMRSSRTVATTSAASVATSSTASSATRSASSTRCSARAPATSARSSRPTTTTRTSAASAPTPMTITCCAPTRCSPPSATCSTS